MESAENTITLNDITQCPICLQTWTDPRSLPCGHTFCLKCLNTYAEKKDEENEEMMCPVCRKVFIVPEQGLNVLPKNFMHQQLLDARRAASRKQRPAVPQRSSNEIPKVTGKSCEMCTTNVRATNHCVDCDQNMCKACSMIHLRTTAAGTHKITDLLENENSKAIRKMCKEHINEQVKLYCEECQKLLCAICHTTGHAEHQCTTPKHAAQVFRDRLLRYQVDVEQRMKEIETYLDDLDTNKNNFLMMISNNESRLHNRTKELKEQIEAEHGQLWNELKEIKERQLKEMAIRMEEAKRELLDLQGFMNTSKDLIEKRSSSGMCHSANDLLVDADSLINLKTVTSSSDPGQINVNFTPATIPMVQGCKIRLVGCVRCTDIDALSTHWSHEQRNQGNGHLMINELFDNLSNNESWLRQQLQQHQAELKETKENSKQLNVDYLQLQRELAEMTIGEQQAADVSDLRMQLLHFQEELGKSEVEVSQLKEKISRLKKPIKKEKCEKLPKDCIARSQSFLSQSSILRVIPSWGDQVSGLAVVGTSVYVARKGVSHFEIYDVENFNPTPQQMKITDIILDAPRTAFCSHHMCLYVRHGDMGTIFRVDLLNKNISTWEVKEFCAGLSVANNYNVLVTLRNSGRVCEYTTHGRFARDILFNSSIELPMHCVQLSSSNYAVSHRGDMQHRVCIVDASGNILNSYGRSVGSGVGQLNYPYHLTVTKHDYVFVSDHTNNRVILLSPRLTHLCDIQTPGHQLVGPLASCFEESSNCLYVGELGGCVLVIHVPKIGDIGN